jgi:hypothetical protein
MELLFYRTYEVAEMMTSLIRSESDPFDELDLLFGNREFLLDFNSVLADYRRRRGDLPSSRCAIPAWVKKAAYFRERGKCALCNRDLSGLIAIDKKQHYDHIVPLVAFGINDPCNIQLLCAGCNLSKGASPARTSSLYEAWWQDK